MNLRKPVLTIAVTALLFFTRPLAPAADTNETVLVLADLPAIIQKAIQNHQGDGTLGEITRTVEEGEVFYDIEVTRKGRERSFTIDNQGELTEEEVFFGELPPRIRKAIRAHVGKGSLDDITKVHDGEEISYEIDMTKDGKSRDFTLDDKGALVEMQMYLEELPEALQTAIKKGAGKGTCGDIYKSIDEGEVSYDVEVQSGGKTRILTFAPDGELQSEEQDVILGETPAEVQKSLTGQIAGGRLSSLTMVIEDGEVTYAAEWTAAGKSRSAVIASNGKVLPPDED